MVNWTLDTQSRSSSFSEESENSLLETGYRLSFWHNGSICIFNFISMCTILLRFFDLFFLILSLLFSFLPCFDWQPWATIVLRFTKKSILLNFVNLSTIFCPRLKEENLQFLKFKYFVRQNFDNNCRSA